MDFLSPEIAAREDAILDRIDSYDAIAAFWLTEYKIKPEIGNHDLMAAIIQAYSPEFVAPLKTLGRA